MQTNGYVLEFDIWRLKPSCAVSPMRIKVKGRTRAWAEKRMRDIIWREGHYYGAYVAWYPNGHVIQSRVVKPVEELPEILDLNSCVFFREYHWGFGRREYKRGQSSGSTSCAK